MRGRIGGARFRFLLAGACILMLAFAAALAAAPICCDDDCSADEGSCVGKCGPCEIVLESTGVPAAMTLSLQPSAAPGLQPVPFDEAVGGVLHVPKQRA